MRPHLTFGLFALVLGACVAGAPRKPITPAPICAGAAQCTAEWAEARTFVLQNTAYKIQTYSSDFMQTYNSTDGSTGLAAEVNMAPVPGGAYRIVASFECAGDPLGLLSCTPPARVTLDKFNRAVAAAGKTDLRAK